MAFRLTILGTSSALPTSDRYPTAHVLNVHERLFLIDCGEGTQMQMRRYKIRFGKINHIFISHLHGDHFFGVYPLLSTFNLMGRKNTLHLYVPSPAEELIARHLADFDINLGYELIVHTVSGRSLKSILVDKRVEVFSFPLKHRITTYGYLFREKTPDRNMISEKIEEYNLTIEEIATARRGGDIVRPSGQVIACGEVTLEPRHPATYAFCSDTGRVKKLASWIRGVDLLYHEATFGDDHDPLALKTGHSTARQAATVALEAGAKHLLLGHFSARYRSPAVLETEAREVFPDSAAAREGATYEIG